MKKNNGRWFILESVIHVTNSICTFHCFFVLHVIFSSLVIIHMIDPIEFDIWYTSNDQSATMKWSDFLEHIPIFSSMSRQWIRLSVQKLILFQSDIQFEKFSEYANRDAAMSLVVSFSKRSSKHLRLDWKYLLIYVKRRKYSIKKESLFLAPISDMISISIQWCFLYTIT